MELVLLTLPYSLILLPAILIFITIFFTFSSSSKNKSQSSLDPSKYPPGRTGWPIVGETLLFYNAGRKGAPEIFIRERMNKFSPKVFKTSLLGETMAVLCGPAGNKFLFSMDSSWWPKSIAKIFPIPENSSSDQVARKLGNLIRQFLKPEALKRYIPIMDVVIQKHIEANWDNKEEVLVFPLSKNFTFRLACRLFLGIDNPASVEKLGEPFTELIPGIYSFPIDLPGTQCNRAIKATKYITNELLGIVKQRTIDLAEKKVSPTQDILSDMILTADKDGQFMSETAIVNMILGFLIGSHDTTSASITCIIMFLAEFPQVYNQVRKEQMEIFKAKDPGELLNWDDMKKMKYSWNVACEVMRLAPPVQGAFREAITDFNYGGFSVPKGWKLYWSVNSTHKSPDYFKDPEIFDPSRFEGSGPKPFTYVPFGGGSRMCPGNEYARLEILAFMYHIVRRYKWEKIVPDEKIVVDPLPMPAKRLPIRLYPQTECC